MNSGKFNPFFNRFEEVIIEDDIVMQFLLRNLFTDTGYMVNSIMDGKDLYKNKDVTFNVA